MTVTTRIRITLMVLLLSLGATVTTAVAESSLLGEIPVSEDGTYEDAIALTRDTITLFDRFPSGERFGDRLFFTGGILGSVLLYDNDTNNPYFTPSVYMGVGRWLNPYSALRFGASLGYTAYRKTRRNSLIWGINADYLYNISAIARGSQHPMFNVSGVVGAGIGQSSFLFGDFDNYMQMLWSLSAGLHFDLRLSPTLSIYFEPKYVAYSDRYDRTTSLARYNGLATAMLGATLTVDPIFKRRNGARYDGQRFSDDLFLYMGLGVHMLASPYVTSITPKTKALGETAFAGIGKWFTQSHGVRLTFEASFIPYSRDIALSRTYGARGDYLLNISNFVGGYNPSRRFSLWGIAGVELDYLYREGSNMTLGAGIGLSGVYRASPHLDLYIEPRLTTFSTSLDGGYSLPILCSLQGGMIYRPQTVASVRNDEERPKGVRSFVTLGGKPNFRLASNLHTPFVTKSLFMEYGVGYGIWFDDCSGLSISFDYAKDYPQGYDRANRVGFAAEYLLDITTFGAGYDAGSRFSVVGAFGVAYGFSPRLADSSSIGVTVGAQARYKLTQSMDLYIEPQYLLASNIITPNYTTLDFPCMLGLSLGLNYHFR